MRTIAALVLLAVVVTAVGLSCGQPAPTDPSVTIIQRASPPIPAPVPTVDPSSQPTAVPLIGTRINVEMIDNSGAGPFSYDPVDLTFNTGDIINFTFFTEAAFHTFTISELDINVEVNAGDVGTFDFEFIEPGTYEIVCVPHQALGMVGTLTIR